MGLRGATLVKCWASAFSRFVHRSGWILRPSQLHWAYEIANSKCCRKDLNQQPHAQHLRKWPTELDRQVYSLRHVNDVYGPFKMP